MFKSFFGNKRWLHWSLLGSVFILAVTWYKVQLDVRINKWFGSFYNDLQSALSKPGSITFQDFLSQCIIFLNITLIYIVIVVLLEFFVRHFVFRWRTAMNAYYMSFWERVRHVEGAAQRVQEDTMRLANIVQNLGVAFIRSIMTLFAFLPILWILSSNITEIPWLGKVDHSLVYWAILSSALGTVLLAVVGIKLPGLEYNNQKVEAAYRKELVYGEDHANRAEPETVQQLFKNVRKNYFRLYKHYLYFDIAKWSYLQFGVLLPYIIMGKAIVAGIITLGVLQQTIRAFSMVEDSFQFLVHSWGTIVELISIYKRLKAFELHIKRPVQNISKTK